MFPVVILAGGFGTRLYPITKTTPKSLVMIAGKPFIIHQLEYLRKQRVKKVVICLNHLGKKIKNKIEKENNFSMKIYYSFDGLKPLGTGGAILKSLPLLGNNFFILYGDSFLPINFKKIEMAFKSKKSKALMTVFKNKNKLDKSNVLFIDKSKIIYNKENPKKKMSYIDYGLTVISASVFRKYKFFAKFDLAKVYQDLSSKKSLDGLRVYDRFYEIGSHSGLKETTKYFLMRKKI